MNDWLHNLPLVWMGLLIFGGTYLLTAVIYYIVAAVAVGDGPRHFKAVSPGILPPLGILFGLFVAFTAAQVGSDNQQAIVTVEREASALRSVVILASVLPAESRTHLQTLIRDYIEETATHEWPMMAHRTVTARIIPQPLAEAVQLTLTLPASGEGQKIAQREITTAIGAALDARLQRILISRSKVNLVKWSTILLQAICTLIAIAMVHIEHRVTSIIIMMIFATGVAASVFLIFAHDRPFLGRVSISPYCRLCLRHKPQLTSGSNVRDDYKKHTSSDCVNVRRCCDDFVGFCADKLAAYECGACGSNPRMQY